MAGWGYAAVIGAALLAAALVLWQRRQSRKILENLGKMLEAAMEGNFTEDSFDESLLSALESSFAHYLAASTVSARKVDAEKEKLKALIGDISHQTKTPIANILLYTQLLKEQPGTTDCLEALEGQTKKLQSLIDALVKTSRLETGVIALHPEPGELGSVVTSAVSQLRPKAEEKGVRITLEHGEANAVFDPKWTEEALYNLLDNAVKYTPSGGRVSVFTTVYPMFSAVHVQDTGPGIAEEEQAKIFQRFYRGTAYREQEGVGIGLYLVRQIAEGQGGFVKVRSQPGQGSTFSLYLPRK